VHDYLLRELGFYGDPLVVFIKNSLAFGLAGFGAVMSVAMLIECVKAEDKKTAALLLLGGVAGILIVALVPDLGIWLSAITIGCAPIVFAFCVAIAETRFRNDPRR
jgi:hypothetical protein